MQQAPLNPRIGMMVQDGRTVFYAYDKGYETDPLIGSLNEIERALGVPLTPSRTGETLAPLAGVASPGLQLTRLRRYAVRVTPNVVLYGSGQTFAESVEHVYAESRDAAISEVRDRVRDVNGRHGQKFTYSARLDP